jgi:hypothetical protein
MSATTNDDAIGFMILSNADFERLTLEERVEYMKSAVVAVQRLQRQIQNIAEEAGKKLSS